MKKYYNDVFTGLLIAGFICLLVFTLITMINIDKENYNRQYCTAEIDTHIIYDVNNNAGYEIFNKSVDEIKNITSKLDNYEIIKSKHCIGIILHIDKNGEIINQ